MWTLPTKLKCAPQIDAAVRWRALGVLSPADASDPTWVYARRLEQEAYRIAQQRYGLYRDRIKRLAHALRAKPSLMDEYAPGELAEVEDRDLDDDGMREWRRQYEERRDAQKREEEEADEDEEGPDSAAPDGAFIKCKQCGSLKVTWTQAQTRSADEAMTVFYQCSKCQKRWKG